jgi:hypothetical protein
MDQIVTVAGAVIAAVVALIAGTFIWKRFTPVAIPQAHTPPPCRVALVVDEHPSWKGEKYVVRYAEHFKSLGFQRIGAYRIPELENQRILALFHPGQKFYACVYDSKTHPTYEIFAAFTSDHSLMGTNSTWARDIEQRPGHITMRLANATPSQVIEALRQHEKANDRIAVTADGFVPAFLKAYISNFNWRLKKCEISRDQIRLEARQERRVLTNEQIEELYRLKRAAYVAQLQEACRAQYRDQKKFDREEWAALKNRLFAIPETYDLKEVINALSYAVPAALDEKQRFNLQRLETSLGDDGIVLVNKIMCKNIAELGLKQIGEVTDPVRAWIMVAQEPAEPVSEEPNIPPPVEAKAAA